MNEEANLISKSPTIVVIHIRNLFELVHTMGKMLTLEEYTQIALVFNSCVDRLIRENEVTPYAN